MSLTGVLKLSRCLTASMCFAVLCGWLATTLVAAEDEKPAAGGKPAIDPTHPLYRPLELAYKSQEALNGLKDYEALFVKQEVVDRRRKTTSMKLKFRDEPFSVYLLFVDPNKGREVIFVQGKNNNKLMVHETGVKAIVGTVALDPKSPDAMADNKYPVTMIGMKNMLNRIIAQWEAEGKFGETTVLFYSPKDTKLGDRPCSVIESQHPQPRDQFKFKMTRLFLDEETNYPIRVEQYGFPGKGDKQPPLVEEYTYSQIKANPGLTDKDFDHTNPSYAYPK